jgi:hypothetical protein
MRSKGMFGRSFSIAELLAAVGDVEPALAPAMVVDCRRPRGGGDTLVEEIRVVLSKDFRPMPASEVGLGQNSGCAGGRGVVPDAPR